MVVVGNNEARSWLRLFMRRERLWWSIQIRLAGNSARCKLGLQEVLNHGRDAAMVTLVDRPPARSGTIEILHQAFARRGRNMGGGA